MWIIGLTDDIWIKLAGFVADSLSSLSQDSQRAHCDDNEWQHDVSVLSLQYFTLFYFFSLIFIFFFIFNSSPRSFELFSVLSENFFCRVGFTLPP